MSNLINLEQVPKTPVAELSNLPIDNLAILQKQAHQNLEQAKRLKDWIDGAISLKYQNQVQIVRQGQGRITGTIHLDDGDFKITSTIPKKVDWNQQKLRIAITRIKESGENPYEYVEASYKISETKFNAWPEHIQKVFRDARFLKLGKETFKIEEINHGGANE